ncbi:MAG: NAD/NADP octopine/nopaline dehydrogenase family protein [Lachnospiraceae bacterium]
MIQNITVIGGGSTGLTAAAWLTMRGFLVTLFDESRFAPVLDEIEPAGGILLRGKAGKGLYRPVKVTTEAKEAVPGAELILVCVPARRHREVAEMIAPYVDEGTDILISPGNLGSFIFQAVFAEAGVEQRARISELEGNICPCRITSPAECTVGLPIRKKRVACLQGSLTEQVIERLEGVLELEANSNVLEGALLSGNYVLHIGTCVISATAIEKKGSDFIMFQDAITPASIHLAALIQEERQQLVSAIGLCQRDSASEFLQKLYDWRQHPEYDVFRTLEGPDSVSHRYIDEDAYTCAALALSIAERLNISMPVLRSIVTLASGFNSVDYLAEGRTLENLGFSADMSVADILAALS